MTYLGELGLSVITKPETKETQPPQVVTYEDTLAFAGENRRSLVSHAWGALLGRRTGHLELRRAAGLEVVTPEGEIDLDASPRFTKGRYNYEGWGVTFASLANAIDSGALENMRELSPNTGSYQLFASYVTANRALDTDIITS